MIYTSYYGMLGKLKAEGIVPIAISVGKPKGWAGESIDSLAPTWAMLKMGPSDYERAYNAILDHNDPREIVQNHVMGRDVALLCWERDINDCHRKMVGEWLREAGYECEEFVPATRDELKRRAVAATGQGSLF